MMAAPALLRRPTPMDDVANVHGIVLHRLLEKEIGPGYLTWDGDPLRKEITERWGSIGPATWERVQAMRLLFANNLFWTEWGAFEKVVAALAGEIPDFESMQPPEVEDISRALVTANLIREAPFSEDVRGYIAAACVNDGVWFLERPLDVCSEALAYLLESRQISLPTKEVQALLDSRKGRIAEESSAAEAQYNVVLDLRTDLADFLHEIADQTKLYLTGGHGG